MNRNEGGAPTVTRLHAGIPVGPGLYGDLAVPPDAIGVTLFAHGSGLMPHLHGLGARLLSRECREG